MGEKSFDIWKCEGEKNNSSYENANRIFFSVCYYGLFVYGEKGKTFSFRFSFYMRLFGKWPFFKRDEKKERAEF